MGQILPFADRVGALQRFLELLPRRAPITGTRERFGSVAERFATPRPYAKPYGLFAALAYEAIAGTRVPQVGFRPAADPEMRRPLARSAYWSTSARICSPTSLTRSGSPISTPKRASNQSTTTCGPGSRKARARARAAHMRAAPGRRIRGAATRSRGNRGGGRQGRRRTPQAAWFDRAPLALRRLSEPFARDSRPAAKMLGQTVDEARASEHRGISGRNR